MLLLPRQPVGVRTRTGPARLDLRVFDQWPADVVLSLFIHVGSLPGRPGLARLARPGPRYGLRDQIRAADNSFNGIDAKNVIANDFLIVHYLTTMQCGKEVNWVK